MRKLFLFMMVCSYVLCMGQATSIVIDNQTPGWLSSKISYGDQQTVKNLKVTGYVNTTDLAFIGTLMRNSLNGYLDLTDIVVTNQEVLYLKGYLTSGSECETMFKTSGNLNKLSLPKSFPSVSPYLLPGIVVDTLEYGSEIGNILPEYLADNSFYGTNSCPKVLILREGVRKIQKFSHDNKAPGLQTLVLPQSLDSIADGAFWGATDLTQVNLPDNIRSIGERAFYYTSFIPDTLRLPSSLKTWNTNSFELRSHQVLVLGNNTEEINNVCNYMPKERQTLIYSSSKRTLIINRVQPPLFKSYSNEALMSSTLYVPKEGYSMYVDPEYRDGYHTTAWINPYSYASVKTIYVPVDSISLNYPSAVLNVGNTLNLKADVYPRSADNQAIRWLSSNPNIANVDNDGKVTAVGCGHAIISAASEERPSIQASCEITVQQPLQSISLSTKNISLNVGQVFNEFSIAYYPADADNKTLTWASSDETVVTVSNSGKVTAIGPGNAKVYAVSNYSSSIKDSCYVIVIQPVTGIQLEPKEIELIVDESIRLNAQVLPSNASNKTINWTSSDISVAMVSPDGTVYGIKPGQATIMAITAEGGFVALCKVTIKPKAVPVNSIQLSNTSAVIAIGETLQLSAIISPDNATVKTVNWSSINPNIASIDANGLVKAIAEGKTQIIATTTDGTNLSAICDLTVEKQFVGISMIQIVPNSLSMTIGETAVLHIDITPIDATNKSIAWSSANPSVATITADGKVTAVSEGNAVIIASTKDGSYLSAVCSVTVSKGVVLVNQIILTPSSIAGHVGDTYTLEALVQPDDATNKLLNWTSTDTNVAGVNNGIVTLIAEGTAIITAHACDESQTRTDCIVKVDPDSGIESVILDNNTPVKIYSMSGVLLYKGLYSECRLTPDYYIIICNGRSYKVKLTR